MTSPGAPAAPPDLFPVALRLEGKRCLVVGGGPVAARKVNQLLSCGAHVTVVAPSIGPTVADLAGDGVTLILVQRAYRRSDVTGCALVMAATGNDSVDGSVADDARSYGVWVNAADDPEHCDVFLTAVHRSGPVTVSVSTSGTSPALARWLRTRLATQVGPEFEVLAGLLAAARHTLHERGVRTERLAWGDLLSDELVDTVRRGDVDEAQRTIEAWAEAST